MMADDGMVHQQQSFASPPMTTLVFSTEIHTPNLETFQDLYRNIAPGQPTVVVIRAGEHTFGGFASSGWQFDGHYYGDPSCFLFSVSRSCRIPFLGRVRGPP